MIRKRLLLCLFMVFFAPLTFAVESEEAAVEMSAFQQLQVFAKELCNFSASFEQTIINSNGHAGEVVSGQFSLSRPNLFRWDYVGDFPQQIIGDGEKIWIHDVELEQVSVKTQAQTVAESPALLLLQPGSLEQHYTVAELGVSEGLSLLSLTPKNEDSSFQRLLIGLAKTMPVMLVLEDSFGQRTEIQFTQQQINSDIDTDIYIFEPPQGVDIIGDMSLVDAEIGTE